jgi:DNA end-binding protein Ku
LEGLFAIVAGDLPGRALSRDIAVRENQFQPDQQEDRAPDPLSQGRRRDRRGSSQRRHHQGLSGRKDRYLEVTKDELENIALESTRTIEIDEFVLRSEIDDLYLIRPYYIVPDGKVGHDAFAVIRETIRSLDQVALARVVLTNREHVIALEARDKGLVGMLLRYPYEVRDASEYFDDIQDVKITRDMLDLAKHIVEQKSGHFEPQKFEDHYETALAELLAQKQKGLPIAATKRPVPDNVVNLMDALWASLKSSGKPPPAARPAKAPARKAAKKRKAG